VTYRNLGTLWAARAGDLHEGAPSNLAALGQSAFFLHSPLGRREGLEALIRDRLTALDREAVCPCGQPLLGALESLDSFMKVGGEGFVELVKVELCSQIRRLLKAGDLAVVLVPAIAEGALQLASFSREQLAGAFDVHQRTPTRYSGYPSGFEIPLGHPV
jgi:hypothetical protein